MDFTLSERSETFRREVREFIASLPPDLAETMHDTGTLHDADLHRRMADEGWLAAGWPAEYGGQERDPFEMAALGEELAVAGIAVEGWGISGLVAHTLAIVGSEQHRREIVPAVLRGEVLMCLGYSEPGSGSDVAAARTKAVRDGGDWVIDGQKMFTTMAHIADYVFLLVRTNTEVAKHKGLTLFLVPMSADGIEVAPVRTLGGERTNITYYNQVRVPDSARVGEVDGGWDVMMVALAFERQPAAGGSLSHLVKQAVTWARQADADGIRPADRPEVRDAIARAYIDLEVSRLMGYRMTWMTAEGRPPFAQGSMAKLFASEALVRAGADILDAVGVDGLVAGYGPDLPGNGWIEQEFRHSVVTTIYAGTSEIQRGIIAEQHLGLPRTRRAS
jgi:alkylation response protein AidB-like acyl-CoA dehydrogenase